MDLRRLEFVKKQLIDIGNRIWNGIGNVQIWDFWEWVDLKEYGDIHSMIQN